jgi:hypothetical protein
MIGFSFKECKILPNISFGIYGDIGGGISERGTLDLGVLGGGISDRGTLDLDLLGMIILKEYGRYGTPDWR